MVTDGCKHWKVARPKLISEKSQFYSWKEVNIREMLFSRTTWILSLDVRHYVWIPCRIKAVTARRGVLCTPFKNWVHAGLTSLAHSKWMHREQYFVLCHPSISRQQHFCWLEIIWQMELKRGLLKQPYKNATSEISKTHRNDFLNAPLKNSYVTFPILRSCWTRRELE